MKNNNNNKTKPSPHTGSPANNQKLPFYNNLLSDKSNGPDKKALQNAWRDSVLVQHPETVLKKEGEWPDHKNGYNMKDSEINLEVSPQQ